MLGSALGEGSLHGALADFLTNNKYQATDQNALWSSFEKHLNATVPIKVGSVFLTLYLCLSFNQCKIAVIQIF